MNAVVEAKNVWRVFDGCQAVRGISFSIERGQVVGFIGANGAGKTTTMRMIATLDLPTRGEIHVCGHDIVHYQNKVRHQIGWMPDSYGTYKHLTVLDYLDFFCRAYGYKGRQREERVEEVMHFVELHALAGQDIDKLSKGQGQRLCLARTLLHDPEILILDEPAAGLDPKARVEFKQLVRVLAEEQKSIFISSHILSELEDMCDTLVFIDKGVLVHQGSAEELKRHDESGFTVDVKVIGDAEKLGEWASLNPDVKVIEIKRDGARLCFAFEEKERLSACLRKMINDGLAVTEFHIVERRLEDAFIDILTKKNGND